MSNIIRNVGIAGDWLNADGGKAYDASAYGGAAAWAASDTSGIRIDSGATLVSIVTNTLIDANDINLGGTGKRGIYHEGGAAGSSTQRVTVSNRIVNCSVSRITDNSARLIIDHGRPIAKTADFTIGDYEHILLVNKGSSCTVTLPSAATHPGRSISISTIQAFTVVSASSNVVPRTGGAAGTAILPAMDGAWADLLSDGVAWNIVRGGASSGTNTGDETGAGILSKLVAVDGAGSGLDADFLDGLSSASFAPAFHTQSASTITDFAEAVDDRVAGLLVAGTNITLNYNDAANTLTITAAGGGGGGSGDVVGPASATDTAIARFDGTTGKLLQNSGVSVTDNGSLVLPENSLPTPAAAGTMKLFSRQIANRLMPAFIGASGLDSTLQPMMARNKIGYWCPPGDANTVPGVLGFTAPTVTGFTATARNVATTNLFTRMRRLGYVTAATAGAVGQWRSAAAQFTVGDLSTVLGGFSFIIRFGISDAAAVAAPRMFMGIGSSITPTNVEPSTLTQRIGLGHGAADTNMKIFYGGSAAQTPIDLGANFPCNTRNTDMYELALFSAPNSGDVHYEVTRLNTGNVATGTIINSGATVLPSNTTLLAPWGFRTNNATALAVGLDVASAYIETDY